MNAIHSMWLNFAELRLSNRPDSATVWQRGGI